MSTKTELWNTTQVAQYLGVKPGTVSAYRHRGQMPEPVRRLGARTHLWDAETIREWSARRTTGKRQASNRPIRERTHPGEWVSYGEHDLYTNEWAKVSLVDVETPNGERHEHHVVTMKQVVVVAVVSVDRRHVGMMWRHRVAPDLWGWEFPGGLIGEGESSAGAAARELAEKQGLTGGTLSPLVTFEPVVRMARNAQHVYVATGCRATQPPTEPNDSGELQWLPLDSIQDRISAGEITDSGSLVALLHLLAFGVPREGEDPSS